MHLSWFYLQLFLSGIFHCDALHPARKAREGQFPYLAFIAINEELQSSWCGGAILDETHILTAAHCVTNGLTPLNHTLVKVMVGLTRVHRLRSEELSIAKITIHPEYRLPKCPTVIDSLLARFKMEERLPMGLHVRKIHHLHDDTLPYGKMCKFAGWGVNNQPDELVLELDLTWAPLHVLEDSECAALLLPSSPDDFCARDVHDGAMTFPGDSGSPLVCHGSLVGLLSAGTGVCGVPDIFVRVSSYKSFIETALQN